MSKKLSSRFFDLHAADSSLFWLVFALGAIAGATALGILS
jgi:hypothetical protein